jgi:hypothetical protein
MVFTNLDLGTKSFNVDLVGEDNQAHTFTFFIPVPGLQSDHQDVDFDNLYAANEIVSYNEAEFRKALRDIPCCVTNKDGTKQGGPINFVMVTQGDDLLRVLIRSGWNETATTRAGSSSKKKSSSDIPPDIRYKPVAPLYYYGRPQDASFREPRASGFERNKLRLWLSPMRFEGQEVWLGQASRDYGAQSAGTADHKLDPDVDETRAFLIQDLWYSQGLKSFGYVKGVGAAPYSEPRGNLTGDPYFTDGHRAVLWVSSQPAAFSEVGWIDWEEPIER